jgi:hypothetical protein
MPWNLKNRKFSVSLISLVFVITPYFLILLLLPLLLLYPSSSINKMVSQVGIECCNRNFHSFVLPRSSVALLLLLRLVAGHSEQLELSMKNAV